MHLEQARRFAGFRHYSRSIWGIRTAIVIAAGSLTACGEPPVGPSAPVAPTAEMRLARVRAQAELSGYVQDGIIGVYTPEGLFELNLTQSTLRIPDGAYITEMPTDVVLNYLQAFQDVIDNHAAQAERIAANTDTALYANCWNGGLCETFRVPARPGLAGRRTPMGFTPPARRQDRRPRGPQVAAYENPYDCRDAALAIYEKTGVWRSAKTHAEAVLREMRSELKQQLIPGLEVEDFEGFQGKAKTWADFLAGANDMYQDYQTFDDFRNFISMLNAGAELMSAKLSLEVTVVQYNALGCQNPNGSRWPLDTSTGRTMAGPSLGGGTSEYSYVCHDKAIKDSEGWIIGVVQVCEYLFSS